MHRYTYMQALMIEYISEEFNAEDTKLALASKLQGSKKYLQSTVNADPWQKVSLEQFGSVLACLFYPLVVVALVEQNDLLILFHLLFIGSFTL